MSPSLISASIIEVPSTRSAKTFVRPRSLVLGHLDLVVAGWQRVGRHRDRQAGRDLAEQRHGQLATPPARVARQLDRA